ncbi:MAG: GyrI-like domain-containing protein [Thermoplasmatota archaeon]
MSAKRHADPLLKASRDHAVLLRVPDARFLTFEGTGSPGSAEFQAAIHALYGVEFTLHVDLKKRGKEHAIHPLEGVWWWSAAGSTVTSDEKAWRWRLMIRQSQDVTKRDVSRAIAAAQAKHPELSTECVRLEPYHEGLAMQILHVGPYKDEAATMKRLNDEMTRAGFTSAGAHHEIYLGDPRRAKPENLKTLLRFPVRQTTRDGIASVGSDARRPRAPARARRARETARARRRTPLTRDAR